MGSEESYEDDDGDDEGWPIATYHRRNTIKIPPDSRNPMTQGEIPWLKTIKNWTTMTLKSGL